MSKHTWSGFRVFSTEFKEDTSMKLKQGTCTLRGVVMSELYEYERYGYDGDRPCAYFDDLDVITCPRCGDGDILPGERVCGRCRDEMLSNEG